MNEQQQLAREIFVLWTGREISIAKLCKLPESERKSAFNGAAAMANEAAEAFFSNRKP